MASGIEAWGTGCVLDMIEIVGSKSQGKGTNQQQYKEHTSPHCGIVATYPHTTWRPLFRSECSKFSSNIGRFEDIVCL